MKMLKKELVTSRLQSANIRKRASQRVIIKIMDIFDKNGLTNIQRADNMIFFQVKTSASK